MISIKKELNQIIEYKNYLFSFVICSFGIFIFFFLRIACASLVAQLVRNPPAMQETSVQFLGREDLREKG